MVEPWLIYFIWWDFSLCNNDIKGMLQTKRKITEGLLADVEFSPEFQWQLGLSWTQAGEFKAVSELPAALDRRHLHSESKSWLSAWLESESTKRRTAGWVLDSVPSKDWLRQDDHPHSRQHLLAVGFHVLLSTSTDAHLSTMSNIRSSFLSLHKAWAEEQRPSNNLLPSVPDWDFQDIQPGGLSTTGFSHSIDGLPGLYLELSLISLLHNMHSFYQLRSLGTPWLMHFSLHLLP